MRRFLMRRVLYGLLRRIMEIFDRLGWGKC